MNLTIEILQEDNDIIVCRKPAGIPVQTAKFEQQDMVSLLKNYQAAKKEQTEIYVVHRLDQPVEGVMVFAKNQKAAASLSKQIQQKSVDKYYYAIVEGVPKAEQGKLEDYLLRDGKTNTSKVVKPETKGAKKAVLYYQVLQSITIAGEQMFLLDDNTEIGNAAGYSKSVVQKNNSVEKQFENKEKKQSLLKIQLETGRHHQIRVQMAYAGHALVGDKKYNPNCQTGYMPIGLCSVGLHFIHPTSRKKMEFSIVPQGEVFQRYQ